LGLVFLKGKSFKTKNILRKMLKKTFLFRHLLFFSSFQNILKISDMLQKFFLLVILGLISKF